ncbi:hypothetical protein [Billgrantia desiderata]|uniref:hypothetical protein n=1 Tax=Billgrantia desiderata TaxID=52021 RepID=UPI001F23C90B|nr:hypothetical protein [Halomonas desiderata]MCE8010801.1 hypothetical protein [Halomonas desiderata]
MSLDTLGLSWHDIILLIGSPILAMTVAGARAASILNPLEDVPSDEKFKITYRKFDWILGWIVFGALSGLLVALLFVGAVKEDIGSLGRVLAIAMLSGYLGPQLWNKQEKLIFHLIDRKIKEVLPIAQAEANKQNQPDA